MRDGGVPAIMGASRRWRPALPPGTVPPGTVRALPGALLLADRERTMESMLVLMILAMFVIFRGLPNERNKQLLLRLEYELY